MYKADSINKKRAASETKKSLRKHQNSSDWNFNGRSAVQLFPDGFLLPSTAGSDQRHRAAAGSSGEGEEDQWWNRGVNKGKGAAQQRHSHQFQGCFFLVSRRDSAAETQGSGVIVVSGYSKRFGDHQIRSFCSDLYVIDIYIYIYDLDSVFVFFPYTLIIKFVRPTGFVKVSANTKLDHHIGCWWIILLSLIKLFVFSNLTFSIYLGLSRLSQLLETGNNK